MMVIKIYLYVLLSPIFVEPTKANDWSILLVENAGVFRELKYKQGSYPSNPSVSPKAPYEAPSVHAKVIFGEKSNKSVTYSF